MRRTTGLACALSIALMAGGSPALGEVRLPPLIGDNMVLQRDARVPVWGTAAPGEKITVSLGDRHASASADAEGRWLVRLDPLPVGGPFEMTVAASNTITLRNVMVGEVWVASGQSNMAWPVRKSLDPEREIAAADHPTIRLFSVRKAPADQPPAHAEGHWDVCSPATVEWFSGVAYFFGRDVMKSLGVPVGLIDAAAGGTPAEAWMGRPALEADPDFKPILDRFAAAVADYPRAKEVHEREMAEWKEAAAKAESSGQKPPPKPAPPLGPDHQDRPAGLYNGMIVPLMPYGIRGVIWYQGESNAARAQQYRKLFPALIRSWRTEWGQGDFPFLFVQLANFVYRVPEPSESTWAELREAQLMTLSVPNTGMAVAIDVGQKDDIHPPNKQEVGRRLALAAQALVYGRDVVPSGPVYESMGVEGSKVRVRFKHVGGGLVAKGDGPLKGFAVAGANRQFVWAQAKIEGDSLLVWSDKVSEPVAVRYAWANNPDCNLYNATDLPASPFRTDDWPGLSTDER